MTAPSAHSDIRLSGRYLAKLEPARVAVAGLLLYIVSATLAPVSPSVDWSSMGLLYAALGYGAFIFGVLAWQGIFPTQRLPDILPSPPLRPISAMVILAIAAMGGGLRMIDRFILRDVPLGEDFNAVRAQLEATQASLFSTVGAAVYPACYVTLLAFHAMPPEKRKWWMGAAAYTLFLYPSSEALLQGSRSLMMISLGFILLSRGVLIDSFKILRNPLVIAGSLIMVINGFFIIFEMRLESSGMDFFVSSQASGYAFTVPPSKFAENILATDTGIAARVMALLVHLFQYYCHSGFELMLIFDHLPQNPLWGAYNFFHFFKLLAMLTGDTSMVDAASNVDFRTGVFATFFVPLFVDFHWAGPAVMAIFGALASASWSAACRRPTVWFPLYSYQVIIIFLMPVTSFLLAAQGLYTIAALVLVSLILSRLERQPARGGTQAAR